MSCWTFSHSIMLSQVDIVVNSTKVIYTGYIIPVATGILMSILVNNLSKFETTKGNH